MIPERHHHDVWLSSYEGLMPLDVVGPHEVFDAANLIADSHQQHGLRYRQHVVSAQDGPVACGSGLAIHAAAFPPPSSCSGTLLIPGGFGMRTHGIDDPVLMNWLRDVGNQVDRIATVCTGTFVAAAAGLLKERRVATHWAYVDQLSEQYPDLDVDPDVIWVRDGHVWSSAGVTAGIDLALAIVEEDLGSKIAQEVAQWLVVFLRRPGGQSQFAAPVWSAPAESAPVREAQELIHADPSADLSVDRLALAVGLSARHLSRRFRAEIGDTPARYVEKVRIEAARRQLETTDAGMTAIARHCGFGTAETLRRTFHRRIGVSPDHYRKRFTTTDSTTTSSTMNMPT